MAANPNVTSHPRSSLPKNVIEKIVDLKLENEPMMRCGYCGNIWIEKFEINNPLKPRIITVGVDNSVAGEGMIWKILDN
ncbi:MAG: hypothetical protein A2355_07955 [Spirochaetes bacterium RIFOXYB1_FULL_32_8]|nr:MAG: hypothetical protein A2355_07955 [Spirochaetes bacterium RIFOXYB1_FULL_32_8]